MFKITKILRRRRRYKETLRYRQAINRHAPTERVGRFTVGCSRRCSQLQPATCPQNLTLTLTLTLCAIVDVAPAAANTICEGLLSQYAAPMSLQRPKSLLTFSTSQQGIHETRGSLNFLTVNSWSQILHPHQRRCVMRYINLRLTYLLTDNLYVCINVSTKTDAVMLNFCQWCKTRFSAFSKKNSATTHNFLHVCGRAPSDLQLCFVQLKTLAPSARYSTFKYPVTLKPGLGVTQGHRKLYHPIRHP